MKVLYKVTVSEVIRQDCLGEESLSLKKNDWCIIRNRRGEDDRHLTGGRNIL